MILDLWVALSIYIYIYISFSQMRDTEDFSKHFCETRPVSPVLRKLSFLWKSGGEQRNESEKVSREKEWERNSQRTNDESSNVFNIIYNIFI